MSELKSDFKDLYQTLANALGIARAQAKKLILERVNLEGRMLDAFLAGWELCQNAPSLVESGLKPPVDRRDFDKWAEGYWSDERRRDERVGELERERLEKLPSGNFGQKFQQVYLPMDCPHCGRRRVEWNGREMKCEKCGASSENEYFSKEQYEIDEKNKMAKAVLSDD